MNKLYSIKLIVYFTLTFCFADAQTWTQKTNFGGRGRSMAIGFSIGTKGYIGTGYDSATNPRKDFWEWNQASNTWTQKANFGGTARYGAVGFSIGTKGYIGTGGDASGLYKDFWEWDQASNTWTQKANFGGTARGYAVGFSIGTKGYIGTGLDGVSFKNDFWEWDQASNTWIQKTNFGGPARDQSVGFSIGTKGYIGTGDTAQSFNVSKKDFWEWNQTTNTWTQKADFGGAARSKAVGFSIGTKGYIGTGSGGTAVDFWEWDQTSNIWTQKPDFGGTGRTMAVGFSIGAKGYIGTGAADSAAVDFWEYCDTCTVGINEINNEISISIFPNPTTEKVVINSDININSIEIYNTQGEKVYSTLIHGISSIIDLSDKSAGIYFIQMKTEKGFVTKKIVVQK